MAMQQVKQQKQIKKPHLSDYYYLFRKRMGLIFSLLIVSVLGTALITFTMKPIYQATATILIDKESSRSPLTGEAVDAENYVSQQLTYRTEFKVITSRPILEKVLAKIELPEPAVDSSPLERFAVTVKANLKRLLSLIYSPPETNRMVSPEEAAIAGGVGQLMDKVNIEEVLDTRLLRIHIQDQDPRTARDLANAIAETAILYDTDTRLQSSRTIMTWLSNELYKIKKKVEDAEKEFLSFKEQENIFTIDSKQKINTEKISDMNSDAIKVRSQRLEVEAKIEQLQKFIAISNESNIRSVPTFINNQLLDSLFSELLNAEVEYRRISGVYQHKHPEMVKVTSKIGELRSKIHQQLQKALNNAEAERAVLVARENALDEASKGYETQAIHTNRKELQYSILEREVDTNKQLYDTLLTKIKEANITDGITKTNLRLVESAALPTVPVRPRKARNMLLSVVLGLLGGAALAYLLEYLDQTIHNKEEVERYFELPVLAEVPLLENPTGKAKSGSHGRMPTMLEISDSGHFAESFRQIATNLRFSNLNRPNGIYLITSSTPGEGKSTISLNLALTLARMGRTTLLVEADLRRPGMKKVLDIPSDEGLSTILVDVFSTDLSAGSLSEWTVADLHKFMEIQEKTGILHYENENNRFDVAFLKGRIVDVDWPTRPPEKRFASVLVQSGKITREQAQIALAKQQATSQRLGLVLLQLGFVRVEGLAGPLKLQIQENLNELYRCRHARFSFREGPGLVHAQSDPGERALIEAMGPPATEAQNDTPIVLHQVRQHLYQVPDRNLWVLPGGPIPPNPMELLGNARMRALLELLRPQFDFILIDSPPIGAVSDASVLAPMCDGTLLLVRAADTQFREISRARQQLEAVQAPIAGIVLNMLDFKKDPYYYGRYYYKYASYYGKQDEHKRG